MQKYTVVFTEEAESDLDEIIDYIAEDNPVRAISFIEELRGSVINTLELAPKGGGRVLDARYFSFGNYVVIYDIDEEYTRVVAHMVMHGSREWWKLFKERMD